MNKIEPQHVSFEIAKLLKEKGFDIECLTFYTKPNSKMFGIDEKGRAYPIKNISKKLYKCGEHATLNDKNVYSAPEIWQVVEWLRLEYGIWIECRHITTFNINRFHVIIWDYKDKSDYKTIHCGNGIGYKVWDTPKEAYLEAIIYTLKELI